MAFSWLKAATTAFTFKTLSRHYAKQVLTPRSLNVKLGPRRNYHKGRAVIRHYANQPTRPLRLLCRQPNFTSTYRGVKHSVLIVNACVLIVNSVLNVKALVGTFNQEKVLVGAFSVLVKLCRLIVYSTKNDE